MTVEKLVVEFSQSGGFAGISRNCTLDSDSMSEKEAQELQKLVHDCGLLNVDKIEEHAPRARDVFYYTLKITYHNKTHEADFDDVTLPQQYRPLLDFLRRTAGGSAPQQR